MHRISKVVSNKLTRKRQLTEDGHRRNMKSLYVLFNYTEKIGGRSRHLLVQEQLFKYDLMPRNISSTGKRKMDLLMLLKKVSLRNV